MSLDKNFLLIPKIYNTMLADILKYWLEADASDIIISPLARPIVKVYGSTKEAEWFEVFTREVLDKLVYSMLNAEQKEEFTKNKELDFAINMKGHSRFRVNAFVQRDGCGAVFRPIKTDIPKFETLGVPPQVLEFTKRRHGLVLVTWAVWSWKSTTLASLLGHINLNQERHIITVEDPVEFIHPNAKSVVEQREVWADTHSFTNGLKYALRQASDVIMVWEMRDLETFRLALRAAETGNLVLATLHTSGAARTISRIIDMFPWEEKDQIRQQLADSLTGVVRQTLVKKPDGTWRTIACEVMMNSSNIANMIRKGNTHQVNWAIETGASEGMVPMERTLASLLEKNLITQDDYENLMKDTWKFK